MLCLGDHLRVWRGAYWHHGIYCGSGNVIHYSGKKSNNPVVCQVSIEDFCESRQWFKVDHEMKNQPIDIVKRAIKRLGEPKYNLIFNNCEHFANWCVTGKHTSKQVALGIFGLLGTLAFVVFVKTKSTEDRINSEYS